MIQAAAYWGPDEGPSGDDAIAALEATWDLMSRLTGIDTWYRTGERPTRSLARTDLPEVLAEGVNYDDGDPRQPIPSLGRRFRVWDGVDGESEWSAAVEGTAATWRGNALVRHPELPTSADEAWPILAEHIRTWCPETASWTTREVRRAGIRAGLGVDQPHMGVLVWARDGTPAPFTGGDTLHVEGGTLYRLADNLADLSPDVVARLVPST